MNPHTHCLRSLCAFLAALVLAACLACPALADAPLVRDEYGLFDADTLAQLESSAEDASAGHDCDVYFLTVDSIGDTDQRAYAKNYYVQNDLGSGSGKSGILFMIALGSRKYVTITYGGGVTAFTDYRIEQLEDEVVPLLSDGDYADAAQTYIDLCASTLDFYAENGEPLDYDNDPDGGLGLIGSSCGSRPTATPTPTASRSTTRPSPKATPAVPPPTATASAARRAVPSENQKRCCCKKFAATPFLLFVEFRCFQRRVHRVVQGDLIAADHLIGAVIIHDALKNGALRLIQSGHPALSAR